VGGSSRPIGLVPRVAGLSSSLPALGPDDPRNPLQVSIGQRRFRRQHRRVWHSDRRGELALERVHVWPERCKHQLLANASFTSSSSRPLMCGGERQIHGIVNTSRPRGIAASVPARAAP
jgi:hypothetical protein